MWNILILRYLSFWKFNKKKWSFSKYLHFFSICRTYLKILICSHKHFPDKESWERRQLLCKKKKNFVLNNLIEKQTNRLGATQSKLLFFWIFSAGETYPKSKKRTHSIIIDNSAILLTLVLQYSETGKTWQAVAGKLNQTHNSTCTWEGETATRKTPRTLRVLLPLL